MADSQRQQVPRALRLLGATGEIRTAQFEGRDHLVVPVIALMEAVIFPFGARTPELVPADVLAVAPDGWNGRPSMADHPSTDGQMVSANSPHVLETRSLGRIFNTKFENGKLLMEGWLDPTQAARVGADGLNVLERLRANQPVEVSVGAFVVTREEQGSFNGREYGAVWMEIVPDHLAFLPDGATGACSVEMGCGAPRAATSYLVTARGLEPAERSERAAASASCGECGGEGMKGDEPCTSCHGSGRNGASAHPIIYRDGWWCVMSSNGSRAISRHSTRASAVEWKRQRRMLAAEEGDAEAEDMKVNDKLVGVYTEVPAARAAADAAMSDQELRDMLSEALKRVESQFFRIESVTPGDNTCVYLIDPDPGGPSPLRPYLRSYTIGADGRVIFGEERTPVRPSTRWVPIVAREGSGTCQCGGNHAASAHAAEETRMNQRKDRIAALIANERTPWLEADRAYLEGLNDERFAEVEASAATLATELETANNARTTAETELATARAAAPRQLTEEQYLQRAPQSIKDIVAGHKAASAARKTALVAALKGINDNAFSETELQAMDVPQLEKLAKFAGLEDGAAGGVDFGGVGTTRLASGQQAEEPPKPYTLAIAKRNGAAA